MIMIRRKIRLFKEFSFFSVRVLFSELINFFLDLLIIKSIKFKNRKISFLTTNETSYVRAVLFGKKEKEVYEFIDKYLREEDIFFDVGANVGVFSIYASMFKNAKSIAFEPEYSNLYLLKKNVILNQLSDKVEIYPFALSDNNDLNYLHLSSLENAAALHSISREDLNYTNEKARVLMKIGTYTMTLDKFVDLKKIMPNMLKIDTDGKELEILKGAKNTLKYLNYIALEEPIDSKNKKDCLDILFKNNFIELKELKNNRNIFFKKNND